MTAVTMSMSHHNNPYTKAVPPSSSSLFSPSYWEERVQCALNPTGTGCMVRNTKRKRTNDDNNNNNVSNKKRSRPIPGEFFKGYDHVKVAELRQLLVQQLEMRVETAQDEGRVNQNLDRIAFSEGLERLLYQAATTLREHLDESTLDQRLNDLIQTVTTARGKGQQRPKVASQAAAHQTAAANTETTAEADLQKQARELLQKAQELKFSFHQAKSCGPASIGCHKLQIPEPVKRFYFGTRLFRTPTSKVTQEILDEAQQNMQDYQAFAVQHLPCSLPKSYAAASAGDEKKPAASHTISGENSSSSRSCGSNSFCSLDDSLSSLC